MAWGNSQAVTEPPSSSLLPPDVGMAGPGLYPWGWRVTDMLAVTMPDKLKHTRITLPPLDPWVVKRGHAAYRGGSGSHQDRRTARLRTRSAQRHEALAIK